MTLKEYLEYNKIKSTGDDRSKVGMSISLLNHNYKRVLEDGWNVKDYEETFLNSIEVSNIIINQLNKHQ